MLTLAIIAALMIFFGIICRNNLTYSNEDYMTGDQDKIKFSDYIVACIAGFLASFVIIMILSNSFKNYKIVEYPLCQVDGRYFIPTPNKNGNICFSFVYKTNDQLITSSTNRVFISDTNPKIVFTIPESSKLGMWGLSFFMGTEFSQSKVYTTPNLFIKDIQGIQTENKKNEELWKWDQLEGTP